jgi:hypothetical protein
MKNNNSSKYPTTVVYEGYDKKLALESVGKGWASLIEEVFAFMEQHKIERRIIQVKEKWGGLRIYTDLIHEEFDKKIFEVEKRSFQVCEVSGSTGRLRNCNGWFRTLSDEEGKDYPVVDNPHF